MSCMFVVVPIVAGSWPLISAAILGASAALGYRALGAADEALACADSAGSARTNAVDLTMDNSKVLAENMARGESFLVSRGNVAAEFRLDGRGQCTVHVSGQGVSQADLKSAGEELMDRVRQQFAYQKVMAEMEQRGFQVVQEKVEADQTIRVRVRRR